MMTEQERQEAERLCKQADVWESAIGDVIDMYPNKDEYAPESFKLHIASLRAPKPHLFVAKAAIDLEALAFGSSNVTARGALVKEIGMTALNERAKAWGLRDGNDYRKGTTPNPETDDKSKPKKPDVSNPFSAAGWNKTEQARLVRANPKLAENLARSCGVTFGSTRPNK